MAMSFFAAHGLQALLAAHGFLAAHGLHGLFAAQGFFAAHGLHGAQAANAGLLSTTPEMVAALMPAPTASASGMTVEASSFDL